MITTRFMPLAGINNRAEDAALVRGGDEPSVAVREALNVDISQTGRVDMRGAVRKVCDALYRNLWCSPLHGDLFGTLGTQWVKIDVRDWSHELLADLGGSWACHCVVNDAVAVAGADGIWVYDGRSAAPLSMHTPSMPAVSAAGAGALAAGDYGVALSWLRGTLESSVSLVSYASVQEGGALRVAMPFSLDASVTHVRLYMSKPGSGQLQAVGDYPVATAFVELAALPQLGGAPPFQMLDAMPAGRFMAHWNGRLLTASARALHFSEPMAPHLYDRRHGFVQFPQRITFVQPVAGGVWVGQVDHVVFLEGAGPDAFVLRRKAAQPPVAGSAVLLDAELAGQLAGTGAAVALWLAANGYVIGTPEGQLVELHGRSLSGIGAEFGSTAVWGDRVLTVMQ